MPSRILIVDSEELPRMELSIQLQEMGHQVEIAEDGREALEVFGRVHPQLVITELLLEQLSGFEVSTRIARDVANSCPVIFYTGFYRNESARQEVIKKYFAVGYFIKPFQLPQMIKAVSEIVKVDESRQVVEPERTDTEETKEEPSCPVILTSLESREEPATQRTELVPEVPGGEAERGIKDITQEAKQSFELMKEVLLETDHVVAPVAAPAFGSGNVEDILREIASEVELESRPEIPEELKAQPPLPALSPELSSEPLMQEPSAIGSGFVPSSRLPKSLKILFMLVFVLLGLSLAYRYSRELLPIRLIGIGQDSTRQPSPPLPSGRAEEGAPRSAQPLLQRDAEKSTEHPSTPPTEQQASEPPERGVAPGPTGVLPPNPPTSPVDQQALGVTQAGLSPVLVVRVSEVSGQVGPPKLLRSPRLVIPAPTAKSVTKPLLVRLEISSAGKVVKSQVINECRENAALVTTVIGSLSDWQFTPMQAGRGETLVKYFSFQK